MVVSDRLGMPPMYMVVDIRWDDYAPEDEIVQMQDPTKDIFQNNIALPISPSRKRWALLRKSKLSIPIDRLYQNHNLLKTHQRFYLDDQVANFILKLQLLFHISLSNIPIFKFSHFVFPYSDSLLADRRAVQCGTAGCVKTSDNQVDQSKPS